MRNVLTVLLMVAAAALLCSCSGAIADEGTVGGGSVDEPTASASSGQLCLPQDGCLSSWSYTWHQGNAAIDMGSASNEVCVISAISGHFVGGGEAVRIDWNSSTNHWMLNGSSGQSGVAVRATCVPWSVFWTSGGEGFASISYLQSPAWSTSQNGSNSLALWGPGAFCYSRGVSGSLSNGNEGGGSVNYNATGGNWQLISTGEPNWIETWAGCFQFNNHPRVAWTDPYYVGVTTSHGTGPIALPDLSQAICGVAFVQGNWPNSYSWGGIDYNGTSQTLSSTGDGSEYVGAQCIYYDLDH